MHLPDEVRKQVEGKAFAADTVGKSSSQVLLYEDMVLKIEAVGENAARERKMLHFLQNRLPVPKLLWAGEEKGMQYLLMSRLEGGMACDPEYMMQPKKLLKLLAEAVNALWAVDASDCPCKTDVRTRLEMIRGAVEKGLVTTDDAEPETYGKGGFSSPKALLRWLEDNIPEEQPVFSHGDLCLPNIFFCGDGLSGFLDLGNSGLADPFQDLALCCRSLRHNASGRYAPKGVCYPPVDPDDLFAELGIPKDVEKMRYFLLLDELF